MEDDYQILASLRHNGGHLWRIITIYYGFSTSTTSHCTACAEYRSSPTQFVKMPIIEASGFKNGSEGCYDTEFFSSENGFKLVDMLSRTMAI